MSAIFPHSIVCLMAATVAGQACTAKDIQIWTGAAAGASFTKKVVESTTHHRVFRYILSLSETTDPEPFIRVFANKLRDTEKSLSKECARCFGENVACGCINCYGVCIFRSTSSACLTCARNHCEADFDKCSGLNDLNRPPSPIAKADAVVDVQNGNQLPQGGD